MASRSRIPGSVWAKQDGQGRVQYWCAELDIGTNAAGKRIRQRRRATSEAEAQVRLQELWLRHRRGQAVPPPQETLETYAMWWLTTVKAERIRESTRGDYEYRLRQWVYPSFGRKRLADISAASVETWMRQMRATGLSIATVNGARAVLGMVLRHAAKSGRLDRNPVELTAPLRPKYDEPTQVKEPWSVKEARRALEAVEGTDLDLFVNIALGLGMRRGEILGLHWSDIDLENGTITVNRTLKQARLLTNAGTVGAVSLVEDAPKTRASHRTLPITPMVLASVMRHHRVRDVMREAAGTSWRENDLVFTSSIGTPVHPSNLTKRLRSVLTSAGVRIIRVHDMRHTSATLALANNVPLDAVSQSLGHSDLNTTKSIYAPKVSAHYLTFADALSAQFVDADSELRRMLHPPSRGGVRAGA